MNIENIIRFGRQTELFCDIYGDYHRDTVWYIQLFGAVKIPVQRHTVITNRSIDHDLYGD